MIFPANIMYEFYKKIWIGSVCVFLFMFVQVAFIHASSGTISIGPVSGLAHSGVGGYHDVDTMILNPSWLVDYSGKRATKFGMVTFVPSFKSSSLSLTPFSFTCFGKRYF